MTEETKTEAPAPRKNRGGRDGKQTKPDTKKRKNRKRE